MSGNDEKAMKNKAKDEAMKGKPINEATKDQPKVDKAKQSREMPEPWRFGQQLDGRVGYFYDSEDSMNTSKVQKREAPTRPWKSLRRVVAVFHDFLALVAVVRRTEAKAYWMNKFSSLT